MQGFLFTVNLLPALSSEWPSDFDFNKDLVLHKTGDFYLPELVHKKV